MSGPDKDAPPFDPFKLEPRLADLTALSGKMMGAWVEAWKATMTGRALPAMNLLNPATWMQDGTAAADAMEAWLGTPQWSDMMSFDTRTLKRFAPALELTGLAQQYAATMTRLCTETCRAFQERATAAGVTLDGSGVALDLWNQTVDETLMAFNRSDAFADLQRRFLRALMALKLEQRFVAGRVAAHYDLPTREEVDELARRVHDLERETRSLRRRLAKAEAAPPAAVAATDDGRGDA